MRLVTSSLVGQGIASASLSAAQPRHGMQFGLGTKSPNREAVGVPMGFLALVLGTAATVSARCEHAPAGPAAVGLTCGALVALRCVAFMAIAVAS